MKTKEIENRFTQLERDTKHIDDTLEKLLSKIDRLESKIYLIVGGIFVIQFLFTSGLIKMG